MHTRIPPVPSAAAVGVPEIGRRVSARPWLWLPAPGATAVNTRAPYFCPATVTGVLVDVVELDFDRPRAEVWPQRQMAALADLHPWPHHCRDCRATAASVDPVAEIETLRRRLAEVEEERDGLAAELHALCTEPGRVA